MKIDLKDIQPSVNSKTPTTPTKAQNSSKMNFFEYVFPHTTNRANAPILHIQRNLDEFAWTKRSKEGYTIAEYLIRLNYKNWNPADWWFGYKEDYPRESIEECIASMWVLDAPKPFLHEDTAAIVADYYNYIENQAKELVATGRCEVLDRWLGKLPPKPLPPKSAKDSDDSRSAKTAPIEAPEAATQPEAPRRRQIDISLL